MSRPSFSLIVPFRGDGGARDHNWDWCLRRWRCFFPDVELCVSDEEGERFNRSRARNLAAALATRDIFVIADADIVPDPSAIRAALEIIEEEPRSWVVAYEPRNYFRLTDIASRRITQRDPVFPVPEIARAHYSWRPPASSTAGMLVMPRAAFEAVGGYDERFEGWGGEDWLIGELLDIRWAPHRRVEGKALHLYHPVSRAERQGNPNFVANMRLAESILHQAQAEVAP